MFQIGQESFVELTNASGSSQGTEYKFEANKTELLIIEGAFRPAAGLRLMVEKWRCSPNDHHYQTAGLDYSVIADTRPSPVEA